VAELLRREVFRRDVRAPEAGGPVPAAEVEIRVDPLTGHTARLIGGTTAPLLPTADRSVTDPIAEMATRTRAGCPFCADRIGTATPRFPEQIATDGRIRRGAAVVFPNVVAYAQHASVGVYDPAAHLLRLPALTRRLMADNLTAQVDFLRRITGSDPAAVWTGIGANHLLPSGSSLFHPHTQGGASPVPTTMQRLLADCPADRVRDYVQTEKRLAERWLGGTGRVSWLASFAPVGPAEVRAFVHGVSTPERLAEADIAELAAGLVKAFGLYDELGFTSFNLAVYGAPTPGYELNLRLIARSPLAAYYRSDSTHLERLHWEAAIDMTPEELTERSAGRFADL
jgi:UDPglucose--hexose-1-phosphate uridylyltransferase